MRSEDLESFERLCPDEGMRNVIISYIDIIIDYNKKINVVGNLNSSEIMYNLILPSLMSKKFISDECLQICDIGSGSGVLGICLKIVIPSVELISIERNSKKVAFINEVLTKLNIKNVDIINESLENIPKNRLQHVDQLLIRGIKLVKILNIIREKVPRGTSIVYFGSEKDVALPSISVQDRIPMPGNSGRQLPLYIYSLRIT